MHLASLVSLACSFYFCKMLSFKVLCLVSFLVMFAVGEDLPVRGGVKELSGDGLKNAEEQLQISLTKLAAGDGPNYKIGKIYSATNQVVSGSSYKFKVDLVDENKATKKCNVAIWPQPWLENGIEVTFDCEGESKLVKKHSA